MMDIESSKVFLPKFLSAEQEQEFYEDIAKFPHKYDNFYTSYIPEPNTLFQGDLIADMPYYKYGPHGVAIWSKGDCFLLSNSCDMSLSNNRMYPTHINYAPILNLNKFKTKVLNLKYPESRVESLIAAIKAQKCSQILYLPPNGTREESIVFLDRIFSIPNKFVDRTNLETGRIATLSFFGNYLTILKISIHFTRMRESLGKWGG